MIVVASVVIHLVLYNSGPQGMANYYFYPAETFASNSDHWVFLMTIISTLFAVFFVYAGFKIDSTKEQVQDARNRITEMELKFNGVIIENKTKMEDMTEYVLQLQYAMSFILSHQYNKAIDSLSSLKVEPMVRIDTQKSNVCNFFIAHCYYEKGVRNNSKEDVADALIFMDMAMEDDSNPLKKEMKEAFEEMKNGSKI